MVEDLKDKFEDEMGALEKAETQENNDHQLLLQDLVDQIEDGKRESEEKKALKAQMESNKGEAEGDLADTERAVEEDTKSLKDLRVECQDNAKDYEERQVARAGEITASDKVGGGSQHLPGLVQTGGAPALAQLRSA